MSKHESAGIRNLALIGGPGTGKTSLSEALLALLGTIPRPGSVKDRTTLSDHTAEEQERQHSIGLGVLHGDVKGLHLNLLDAPGYPDFSGEAAAALVACETAVMCVKAGQGVTFSGRRTWDLAGRNGKARCVVVTHMDAAEIDLTAHSEELSEALGVRCVPVVLADGAGATFAGTRLVPLGPGADGDLEAAHDTLVEAAVEVDDEAMTAFLEDTFEADEAHVGELLTRAIVEGSLVPVLAVSCLDGKGVDTLLEFIRRSLPSPLQGPWFRNQDDEPLDPTADGSGAFVFKTVIDPFVGKLCLLRVLRGELSHGQDMILARTGKHEKLHHFEAIQGKDHKATDSAVAGDIVAVTKLENLQTGDTLCDAAHPFEARPMILPGTPVARAIEPVDHGDEVKLSEALRRAHAEDPTFVYERSQATGELVAHGVTLLHLETVLRRIKERHKIEVKVDLPRVPLQETCTSPTEGHHRHKKQTGGRGQFAEVFLRIEPAARGTGLDFENATVGGSIPKNFIPAIEKGVHEAMARGIIAGYPVVDVKVSVYDGKYHDVDSDEASFKKAGARAFQDAFLKARPVLLEPVQDLEVAVPSRFMGNITSDLTGRRGHITGMDALGDTQIVKAPRRCTR